MAANCKKVDALTAIGERVKADSLALEIHGRTVTRGWATSVGALIRLGAGDFYGALKGRRYKLQPPWELV